MANFICVAGNLGKDAVLRQTQTGKDVLSFSVGDNQLGKDQHGEPLPPLWWNCQLWGERAIKLQPYLLKGKKVTVFGRASTHTYRDQDGSPRFSLDINVHDVTLQDSRQDGQQPMQQPPQQYGQPQQQQYGQRQQTYADVKGHAMKSPPPQPRHADEAWQAGSAPSQKPFDDFGDDDIPF